VGGEQSRPESESRQRAWVRERIQMTIRAVREHPWLVGYNFFQGFILGAGGVAALYRWVLRTEDPGWLGLTAFTTAAFVGGVLNAYSWAKSIYREIPPESLKDRVKRLTVSLQHAMVALEETSAEMQKEIDQSQQLLAKLAQDARTYEHLAQINRPEVEAIAVLVRGEVKTESSRSSRQQFLVNLGFFVAGAVLSVLLQ
jgi:hypothetical protein